MLAARRVRSIPRTVEKCINLRGAVLGDVTASPGDTELASRYRHVARQRVRDQLPQDVEVAAYGPDVAAQERAGQRAVNAEALGVRECLSRERRVHGYGRLFV